ncbi:MAG: biopolymer transporter ExbD [Gammaproteobacteria bacterium]|nr:MAG: biopolymer transporter ExbD [Gammaproteobacteria bacterium]
MRLRTTRQEEPEVNLTPLIDVVFLLLIFFMISTTFKRESELTLNLPEASGEPIETELQVFELIIDKNGVFSVGGHDVLKGDQDEVESLMYALRKELRGKENLPFVIRADEYSPHKAVVTAMDAASQLGISKVSFATSVKEKKSSKGEEE